MEWNLSEKVAAFCRDHSLDVKLSSEMPAGYETAFGTYDVTVNTLFLNEKLLERAPQWEVLYYLYHELRHAMQYQHPEKFSPLIQEKSILCGALQWGLLQTHRQLLAGMHIGRGGLHPGLFAFTLRGGRQQFCIPDGAKGSGQLPGAGKSVPELDARYSLAV